MTVLDASAGGLVSLDGPKLGKSRDLPVLLVGTDPDEVNSSASVGQCAAAAISQVLSAPPLAAGIALAFAVFLAPAGAGFLGMIWNRLRGGIGFRSWPILAPLRLLWRARVTAGAIAGGALVAMVVKYSNVAATTEIVIEPAFIDVGRVPVGSQKTVACKVSNIGSSPHEIGEIWRSCSCLDVALAKRALGAGQTTSMNVSLMVGFAGDTEQTVSLTPNEPPARKTDLRIRYHAFDAVRLEPVSFNAGEFAVGLRAEKRIHFAIKDFEGERASFESIEPAGDVHVLDAEFDGPQEFSAGATLKVRLISRPDAPLCRFAQKFVVKTSGNTPHSFVVDVHGEVVPVVRVEPRSVVVDATRHAGGGTESTVRLRSLGGPIEVASIAVEPPIVRADLAKPSGSPTLTTLIVRPNNCAKVGGANSSSGELVIRLTRPTRRELRIPVYQFEEGNNHD